MLGLGGNSAAAPAPVANSVVKEVTRTPKGEEKIEIKEQPK